MMTQTNVTLSAIGRQLALDDTFCRWLDRETGRLDRSTQRLAAYAWLCAHFECAGNLTEKNSEEAAYEAMTLLLAVFIRAAAHWGLPASSFAISLPSPLKIPVSPIFKDIDAKANIA